jgi:hypothetical protein
LLSVIRPPCGAASSSLLNGTARLQRFLEGRRQLMALNIKGWFESL